MTGSGNRLISL